MVYKCSLKALKLCRKSLIIPTEQTTNTEVWSSPLDIWWLIRGIFGLLTVNLWTDWSPLRLTTVPHKLAIEHWRSLTSGSSQFIEWEAALTQRAKSWRGGRWLQGGGRSNRRGWDRGGSHRRRTSHPIRSEIYYTLITVDLSFQKIWCDMA